MFKFICKIYHAYKEAIDYLFWGGMTTVVSWGSYSLFVLLGASVFWGNVGR